MVTKTLFSLAATTAKTLCLVAAATMALSIASCSDDDDEDGGGASGADVEAGAITGTDGSKLYITSADWMRFDYDSNWQLTGWGDDDYYYFNVSYNPLRMEGTFLEDYDDTEESVVFSNFSINDNGYATKFSYSNNGSDSYWSYSSTATYSFEYNSAGQLTKYVCNGSGKETYEGESYSYSGKLTTNLTWSDGVITKITEESTEDGYSELATITFDYGSNQYANPTKQYTNSTMEYLFGDYCALPFLGYLGVGPTYLPVSATYTWVEEEDGETYYYTDTEKYSYGFNDNGTVNWENWNGDMVYYTYSDGSSSTAANVRAATTLGSERTSKVRSHQGHNFLRRASQRLKAKQAAEMQ